MNYCDWYLYSIENKVTDAYTDKRATPVLMSTYL